MPEYPPWLPPAAVARIEFALQDAEQRFDAVSGAEVARIGAYNIGLDYPADRAAVQSVVEVLEHALPALGEAAQAERVPPGEFRATAERLRDGLIRRAYERHVTRNQAAARLTLQAFTSTAIGRLNRPPRGCSSSPRFAI